MPLLFERQLKGASLALWQVTEREAELAAQVTPSDVASAARFGSPGRRREHLAWRALLRRVLPEGEVVYDACGAPHVEGCSVHLGVSHCGGAKRNGGRSVNGGLSGAGTEALHNLPEETIDGGVAALVLSPERCAVDVEAVARNFDRVRSRFVSPVEERLPAAGHPLFLPAMWCVKETLYKYAGRRELDLLADLQVLELMLPDAGGCGHAVGRVADFERVEMQVERWDDYLIVWT